jgi:hypothetical protein
MNASRSMTDSTTSGSAGLIRRLGDGLTRLGRITAAVPDAERWRERGDGEWSAHDVLVHMRASSEVLTPRVLHILVRDNPPLPAFDERAWAEVAGFAQMTPDILFARIAVPRYELIQMLQRIPAEAWRRAGMHEVHGAITLAQIVAHLIGHDEEHLAQIAGMLSQAG